MLGLELGSRDVQFVSHRLFVVSVVYPPYQTGMADYGRFTAAQCS